MPYLHLPTGSYHQNDCDEFDRDVMGDSRFIYVSEGVIESGSYPKGTCCYSPEAGDSPADFISL